MPNLIIDGDVIVYASVASLHKYGTGLACDLIDHIHANLDNWAKMIDKSYGIEDTEIHLSGTSFRYDLYPDYKGHRPDADELTGDAKELLMDEFGAQMLGARLEADDTMGWVATCGSDPDCIIVSTDKDMNQIPCRHFNPHPSHSKKGVYKTTEAEGHYLFCKQWLMGDSIDNYGGVPGIGDKKADKILDGKRGEDLEWAVICAYAEADLDLEYCLTMARLARILRVGEIDNNMEPLLWSPDFEFDYEY